MVHANKHKPPRSDIKRETLRTKGQFWTPDWTADFMIAYVLKDKPRKLLDPALGEGVFFRAAKRYAQSNNFDLTLFGRDIDLNVITQAKEAGLDDDDLRNVELRDFVLDPPSETFPARNRAGVIPLTCLLCVYPRGNTPDYAERLWNVLSHPLTIGNLRKVGKSYGGDAIKVEPRALERLPLPEKLVRSEGLDKLALPKQATLFDRK